MHFLIYEKLRTPTHPPPKISKLYFHNISRAVQHDLRPMPKGDHKNESFGGGFFIICQVYLVSTLLCS